MRKTSTLLLMIAICFISSITFAQNSNKVNGKAYFKLPSKATTEDYEHNTVIVKIKKEHKSLCEENSVNIPELNAYLSSIGLAKIEKKFPHASAPPAERNRYGFEYADLTRIYQFSYIKQISIETVINTIYSLGIVEYVEPNYIPKMLYTPNDPKIAQQWHIAKIKCQQAWDVQKGDTNVVVGICDTGYDLNHFDLQPQIKYNYNDPVNGIDDDNDGYIDNYNGYDLGDSDNNPTESPASPHGVHVSGCAAAATDNGNGGGGPAFNCKILPVKIADDANGTLSKGYEGITYAADHGAKVINCSWGGAFGGQSGQDVITYASINKDALVVAAAGNDNQESDLYPAAYTYVLAIGSTDNADKKSSFSNYGKFIDVCAPGSNIYATLKNNGYGYNSGTSMASPVAAGAAALVRSQFPQLNALQAGEQLKVNADNIDNLNTQYTGKLGTGRVNLFNAVSNFMPSPSISMIAKKVTDNGDEAFLIGDTIEISGEYMNYLATSGSCTATLTTTTGAYVTIVDGSSTLGVINTMGKADNYADPFKVVIKSNAPINAKVSFNIKVSDGTYTSNDGVSFTVNVDYINIGINEVATTVTSKSLIGFNDFSTQLEGLGFRYLPGGNENLLFEGGLLIGVPNKVSDNVRGSTGSNTDTDFKSQVVVKRLSNSTIADVEAEGVFNDFSSPSPLSLEVKHKAYAWNSPGHKRYVLFTYNIKNTGNTTLNDLYTGIFCDWDIQAYDKNKAATDTSRRLGYIYNTLTGGFYAGVSVVSDNAPFIHYGVDHVAGGNGGLDLADGYTTAEKYTSISTNRYDAGVGQGNDVFSVVSTGPFNLNPGDTVVVAFAMLGGDNLNDILSTTDSAKVKYDEVKDDIVFTSSENQMLNENNTVSLFPNPARSEAIMKVDLINQDEVTVEIYDILGKKLGVNNKKLLSAGTHYITIDLSNLSNGVYIYKTIIGNKEFNGRVMISR